MSIRCWCLFMHWYWYIYIYYILDVIGNHSINITNINIKTTPKVLGSQHHCALPRLDRHQRRDLAASAPGAGTTRRRRGGGRVGRGLRHSGMVAAGGVTSPPCCSSFAGDRWKGKKNQPRKRQNHMELLEKPGFPTESYLYDYLNYLCTNAGFSLLMSMYWREPHLCLVCKTSPTFRHATWYFKGLKNRKTKKKVSPFSWDLGIQLQDALQLALCGSDMEGSSPRLRGHFWHRPQMLPGGRWFKIPVGGLLWHIWRL